MSPAGAGIQSLQASPGRPIVAAAIDEHPALAVTHSGNNCGAVLAQYPTTLH
jgi:hypothetical protein